MEKTNLSNFLSDLTNINLVILGLSVTIFTVIYSFLKNKIDEVIIFSDNLKNEILSPSQKQKIYFSRKYITIFKEMNKHWIHLIVMSFILFVVTFLVNRVFALDFSTKDNLKYLYLLGALTTIVIIYFLYSLLKILLKYSKEIKI